MRELSLTRLPVDWWQKFDVSKWLYRVYSDRNFGRNIALPVALTVGLAVNSYTKNPTVSIVIVFVVFFLTKVLVTAIHPIVA